MKKLIALTILIAAIFLNGCVSIKTYDPSGKMVNDIRAYIPYQYNLDTNTININDKTAEIMGQTILKSIEIGGAAVTEKLIEKAIEQQNDQR